MVYREHLYAFIFRSSYYRAPIVCLNHGSHEVLVATIERIEVVEHLVFLLVLYWPLYVLDCTLIVALAAYLLSFVVSDFRFLLNDVAHSADVLGQVLISDIVSSVLLHADRTVLPLRAYFFLLGVLLVVSE